MFSLKIRTAISGAIALVALCTFGFSARAQDPNQLQSIDVQTLSGQQVQLKLHLSGPAPEPLPFTIEGDDAIVEFDPSFGVIETRGRKLFLIDKATAAAANTAWQDFPVSIHFHCDQMSNCVLMHSGLGALRVRMKR